MSMSIAQARQALERGDFDAAIQASERSLRRRPKDIAALTVLARARLAKGESNAAAGTLAEIVKLDPGTAWAFVALGDIYLSGGQLPQAEALLRKALLLEPDNAVAQAKMGIVLCENNDLSGGEFHLRQSLRLNDKEPGVLADLALNLTQQGRTGEAHSLYAQACERAPDDTRITAYRARLYELEGDLQRADALLKRVERRSARDVDLLRASLNARRGHSRQALAILENAAELSGDALLERGRIYDKQQEYERAWADFAAANRYFRQQSAAIDYEAPAVEAFFSRLSRFFSRPTIEKLPVATVRAAIPQPIFIVGSPRSGTTLLERVLSCHSAVVAGGELPFIAAIRVLAERLLPGGKFPENLRLACFGDYRHVASLFRDYYFAKAEERGLLRAGRGYFTDKMPFNECYLPLIRMAFPKAPIIHLVRHPLDVVVSMFANKLNHGFYCAYSLEGIVHHLLAVHELHEHYRRQMTSGEIVVQYERLVSDPEAQTRRLLAAAGLAFEDACLTPQKKSVYSPTPSYAAVGDVINTRAVNRFVHYADKLEKHLKSLQPLLDANAYRAA